jgi:hypothetical protein
MLAKNVMPLPVKDYRFDGTKSNGMAKVSPVK